MSIESLTELLRAHLNSRKLTLSDPKGALEEFELAFTVREMVAILKDAVELDEWREEPTRRLPISDLEVLQKRMAA